jgi:glycerophosphoryl diester phosphodiesterase
VRGGSPYRRVGHKGADLIAPGNTAASFDAALAAGVDMIEFDVLPRDVRDLEGSDLILAHDYEHDISEAPTLEDGLAHLCGETFADVELQLDLKWFGYEERVVEALRTYGVVERTLISSMYRHSLTRIREFEPALRLGWSVPRVRRDYTTSWLTKLPAYAALVAYRRLLPDRAQFAIRSGAIDALMAHWLLVTPRLVTAVRDAGGDLYVWTVDDPAQIAKLERLGVTGIISNDPRLFVPS